VGEFYQLIKKGLGNLAQALDDVYPAGV